MCRLFFHARYYAENQTVVGSILTFVPTVVYTVVILVVNVYYRQLAKLLNDWGELRHFALIVLSIFTVLFFRMLNDVNIGVSIRPSENHRLQSAYENHLIAKLVVVSAQPLHVHIQLVIYNFKIL